MDKHRNASGSGRMQAQLRKHYYLESFVVIAPQRTKRPQKTSSEVVSEKLDESHPIESEESLFEIKGDSGDWHVKVVKNRYPAFLPNNQNAQGAHEVVIETPETHTPFAELSVDQIAHILQAYQQRVQHHKESYKYVSVFKNNGARAGASLNHAHSQIIATNITPPLVRMERKALTQYQETHGTSALCDVIRWELTQAQRVVAHTRHSTTLCPYASQLPLEAWVIPNRQHHSITDLSEEEVHSLADHLKGVATALTANSIDFNFHLHEGIEDENNHFHIRLLPRISPHGGFEFDTDIFINPISPEYARKWYQKYIKIPHAL